MAQGNSNGMERGFIMLAQEQLDRVEERLAQVTKDIADLRGERATLIEQRAHLNGIVNPSAETGIARARETDVRSTRNAVVDIIRERGEPMHFRRDIYPLLVRAGYEIGGKDPANTLLSRIINDERLCRTAPGVYYLAARQADPSETAKAAEVILRKAGSPLLRSELAKRVVRAKRIQMSSEDKGAAIHLARFQLSKTEYLSKAGLLKLDGDMIGLAGRDEAAA